MSGHSKWSTIKHQKGAQDKKRGQLFSKLARAVTIAAKEGKSGDPAANPRLRLAIEQARRFNVPKENIERAIGHGAGKEAGEAELEEMVLEAYGPGGVALLIEVVTDNRNRSLAEIRHILSQYGGRLGVAGTVRWMFSQQGIIRVDKHANPSITAEAIATAAIEAGAADLHEKDGAIVISIEKGRLLEASAALGSFGIVVAEQAIEWIPAQQISLAGHPATQEQFEKLITTLDGLDDVQEIYSNLRNQ